jgi:hypothetical protein
MHTLGGNPMLRNMAFCSSPDHVRCIGTHACLWDGIFALVLQLILPHIPCSVVRGWQFLALVAYFNV